MKTNIFRLNNFRDHKMTENVYGKLSVLAMRFSIVNIFNK